jgi:hypothetical protein
MTGVWTTLASTLHRRFHAASLVLGGCLYAAGGIGSSSAVERYDVAADTWTVVANMIKGHHSFGAVTIGPMGPAEEQDLFDCLISKIIREGE